MKTTFKEIDKEALNALIGRVEEAIEYNLALTHEDIKLLLDALCTLMAVQERLTDKGVTIKKLQKLLGMINASEKLNAIFPQDKQSEQSASDNNQSSSSNDSDHNEKKHRKPRKEPTKPVKPDIIHHNLEGLNQGDNCPDCGIGKVYEFKPAVLLRVSGRSPYDAIEHMRERLRCNACGTYFTADLPEAVLQDGDSQQKYGYSSRSLITIQKAFAGLPYYRQEALQLLHGLPMAASSQFDQVERVANSASFVFNEFKRQAANASNLQIDDTPNRIIDQKPVLKKKRRSQGLNRRTGVYTSGMVAYLASGNQIILFQTNIGHAGEFIDETLILRDQNLPIPIIMSDALSSNKPTVGQSIQALCNVHGRRQFVEVANNFPLEVEWVLNQYKLIWIHEDETKAQNMTLTQRLQYHKQYSLPVMEVIRQWGEDQLALETTEPNSGLTKAIQYFSKHFEGLTQFCRVEGAPIDNNETEQTLKIVIRNRKNSMFFKTSAGAAVYDVVTSVIVTAYNYGANAFHYLNMLQRYSDKVKAEPSKWLPWNYEENLKTA